MTADISFMITPATKKPACSYQACKTEPHRKPKNEVISSELLTHL